MEDHLDERLRRRLVRRRGQLHAFAIVDPRSSAVVIIDMVTSFLTGVPGGAALAGPINGLTAAMRKCDGVVAWVMPTSPTRWRSHQATRALLGPEALAGYERDMADGGPGTRIDAGLTVAADDWIEPCLTRLWQKGEAPTPCRGWVRGVGDRNEPRVMSPCAQRDPAPHPCEPERLSGASPQTRMGPGWNSRWSAWTSARPGSTATWRAPAGDFASATMPAGIQDAGAHAGRCAPAAWW